MENCHDGYLTFDEKCKEVAVYCARAAGACSRMADEAKTKKNVTKAVGGTVAGGAIAAGTATGIGLSVLAGVFTFGIGTVIGLGATAVGATVAGIGTGVTAAAITHVVASDYEEAERNFRKIGQNFANLCDIAHRLDDFVLNLKTNLACTETLVVQLESTVYNSYQLSLAHTKLKCLYELAVENYRNSSRLLSSVNYEKTQLEAKIEDI